ncbi:MAG: lipid-A-disaccharide synthase [Candidatus Midichloria mitochondrii]|uniref:Lipid-A-disaccharide synthase n=1 Tax=Midichloria mitochondrii (strain IricVA) TaxID=696127 RepID=F7XWC3_MIDMI|nr:lipid-A-disaccharide synthase [Candidatus Midichloria mitochondrii]AEI88972.1 lipid-A-disaccharide synthase [Candidatus Midichloria mitochondrii IricVA]MDJ1255983.1 lipid-A-disaccharide synthase [Candidatus Midichloria mitochondrii]MDJ1287937.1 lipid-A-disaccharide synthase [Candidatus Midichloria mitochondrii]MDJ1298512.1 lipid-A-disaccharide synthase [Candidatus Midichloria mitochondrii]MDJ1312663.1 lipid-A-disaccharide synthase [Candidatus Midichloria mitochondrii]
MAETKIKDGVGGRYKIAIIAGEPSGDLIAAKLLNQLQQKISVDARGVGGENMIKRGFKTIFPMKNLSIMGYFEGIAKLPIILIRLFQTARWIKSYNPDILITVDSPGFNLRLVKKLRKQQVAFPIVQYVAPTVWAYKTERAKKFADLYDHIFAILPFEKKYFDEAHLPCTYVGHPVLEDEEITSSKEEIKEKFGFNKQDQLITVTPGSREQEIKYHLKVLLEAVSRLISKYHGIYFIIPTFPRLLHIYQEILSNYQFREYILLKTDAEEKRALLYASNAAFIKSGTVAIECALLKVPMLIFYKVSKITAWLIRKKIKIRYISILNLMADKMIIPELIQENFTADNLFKEMDKLLEEGEKQVNQLDEIIQKLKVGNATKPSQIAAEVILKILPERDLIM